MMRFVVITLALLLGTAAFGATVSYTDMARASATPAARQALAAFDAARDDAALAAMVHEVLANGALDALTRDLLLAAGALRLANVDAGAAGNRLLHTLEQHPVSIFVRHEHAGRTSQIPAYDVAAAARYAAGRRARRGEAQRLVVATRAGQPLQEARRSVVVAGKNTASAIDVMAVAQMDPATLASSSAAIHKALPSSPELAGAATAAALRLDDDALLVSVLRHGDDPSAMAALRAATRLSSSKQRLRTVEAAIAREHTAAAALNALADIVADDPAQTPRILTWLDRPETAFAAAAAVARLDRPDLAAAIADRLDVESDAHRAAALALSLSLMRNDVAVRRLGAYLDAPGGVTRLKTKLIRARTPVRP